MHQSKNLSDIKLGIIIFEYHDLLYLEFGALSTTMSHFLRDALELFEMMLWD
jgi:hypothetical protein